MYSGVTTIELTDEEWNDLYSKHRLKDRFFVENEYIYCPSNTIGVEDAYFQYRQGQLKPIVHFPILENSYTGTYKPRNPEQFCAFDMLKDRQTTIKLITGTFGTGKTLALVVAALEALEKGEFERIIWVRNNVQVKDTDPLGALPGLI